MTTSGCCKNVNKEWKEEKKLVPKVQSREWWRMPSTRERVRVGEENTLEKWSDNRILTRKFPLSPFPRTSQTGKTHRVTLSNIHIHDSWIMGLRKGKGERKRQISEQVLSGYVFVIPPFFFSFYVLLVLCLSPFYGDFMPRTRPEMTLKVPVYSKAKKLAKTKAHCCTI